MPTVGDFAVGTGYRKDMTSLGSRIRQAREAAGLTQDDIASHFGIRRVSVTQWEGDITKPAVAKVGQLAALLGVSPQWLLDGVTEMSSARLSASETRDRRPMSFKPLTTPGKDLVGDRDFPIYAAAMGGTGHMIVSFDAIEVVKRPAILEGVRGAYGLLVMGDSMHPAYKQGDMALVHPHLPPARDEDVVLYDHPPDGEAEAIIKHLVGWTDKEWILEQYRPAKEWRELKIDWPTCHRVVGKYNKR